MLLFIIFRLFFLIPIIGRSVVIFYQNVGYYFDTYLINGKQPHLNLYGFKFRGLLYNFP